MRQLNTINLRNLRIMNTINTRSLVKQGNGFLIRSDTTMKARNGRFDSAFNYVPKAANSNVAIFGSSFGSRVGI